MALQLLLRDHPQRAIALATDSHALILWHSSSSAATDLGPHDSQKPSPQRCMVEFSRLDAIDLTGYRTLHSSAVHGTLGLININTDVYLCVISGAVRVATVRPGETIQRILSVEFYCLNRDDFDHELHGEGGPYSTENGVPDSHDYNYSYDSKEPTFEHPCHELIKILGSGTFYYSVNFDLTNRLQNRSLDGSAFDIDSLDDNFLWNSYMIDPLIKFRSRLAVQERKLLDESRILTSTTRGFALTITVPASSSPIQAIRSNKPSTLTLISRLSCRRAGTRFNSRGIDDDGNVANFVETETVYWYPSNLCFSYSQIRGSVPIFWEQAPGLLPGQQKIQITRSIEATQPAFDKHFEHLELNYGTVHILNLLSESKPGEVELTARYKQHVSHSPLNQVILQQSQFDFHSETKGPGGYEAASAVRRLLHDRAEGFAYFMCDDAEPRKILHGSDNSMFAREPTTILQQEGVFRTNCLDCLDRTNLVQTIISQMALESFFAHRNEQASADFWMRHSSVWADSGDALSKIYAGTGALKSSFTRHGKMSLAGAIADARKSAARMYINNFADKGRQNVIDMLLGRLINQSPVHLYDPINDYVNTELKRRMGEYSTTENVQIWVGTFNVNGRGGNMKENLSAWLCPNLSSLQQNPEIVAVGFQEIVELSPQQIMSTDPDERQAWENAVRTTLNDNAQKKLTEEYILVRTGQLVGAVLMIFVRSSALKNIKNVEGSVKKTGLSGIAGNKGAVAIRLDYAKTRMCFVTAHLAAGFANYEERNRDYRTISHGLRFQRNRSIEDHDTIIWLGDFNYRIGLSDDKVRRLINMGDLETLYQNDQLNLQMVAGHAFPFYSEARITFEPTYKYKNGTDDYDTSEKSRIPAWCDRVLRKGDNLRQINYTTAPLRFSDHRPVFATFQCTISNVNEPLRDSLSREIYKQRKLNMGITTANARDDGVDDEDLIGYESIAPELPPASSDRRKWWLDNGLPAQSRVEPPIRNSTLNSQRSSNPFTPSNEPDWVIIPKSSMHQGLLSRETDLWADKSGEKRSFFRQNDARETPSSNTEYINSRGLTSQQSERGITASPASSVPSSKALRGKAPPIPQKPAVLTGQHEQNMKSSIGLRQDLIPPVSSEFHGARETPLPFSSTRPLPDSKKTLQSPQLLPRRSSQREKNKKQPDLAQSDGPPLPPRRSTVQARSSRSLLDEDDNGARAIPSLQPVRRC